MLVILLLLSLLYSLTLRSTKVRSQMRLSQLSILPVACYVSDLSDQNTEALHVALHQYFAYQHVLFIHGQIFFILLL